MIKTIIPLTLKAPFPDVTELWVCPKTGLYVPKDIEVNLRWRANLLKQAEGDDGLRSELFAAASESLLYWMNAFAWTKRVFVIEPDGARRQVRPDEAHVPYVTWAVQDEHLLEIEAAIDRGYDLLTDKSRDMGATWNHIAVVYHKWLFEPDRSFLMLSRKENTVDSAGKKGLGKPADPGTLFGKFDYITSWLPKWMIPNLIRTTLHLVNQNNGSRIDGESGNPSAGSSDRRTAILLDEMAKMEEAEAIKRSTFDVAACRLANSTPNGAGTAFSQWRLSGKVKVFVLPWWEHPEKGVDRHFVENEITGKRTIRSPWYLEEEKRRTPKEMAIDVDMDHVGSGDVFFEPDTLAKHRKSFASEPPISTGYHIVFKPNIPVEAMTRVVARNQIDSIEKRIIPNGPWTFFTHLIDGRPDQTLDYVFGIDISKGMEASNSVISVGCIQTRRKIAEWASGVFAPHDFALIVAASAVWFGGSQRGNRPFVIWEANGDPGINFSRVFVKTLHYPNCYLDRHAVNKIRNPKASKYGWHSSAEKKSDLLGDYRRALAHGAFKNSSEIALVEAEGYVYLPSGAIGPASLVDESPGARKTHGDRVIADALCHKGMSGSKIRAVGSIDAPDNSFGKRWQDWKKQRKDRAGGQVWDFRRSGV